MVPEKLKQFIESFEGKNKGRYHIMYLTLINIVGGDEIRQEAQEKFGRERYLPDEMYPVKEGAQMVIYAMERGVSAERLGRALPQTYKRANPDIYNSINLGNAIDALVMAFSQETDYGEKSFEIMERGENRALIKRRINPMPCDFFKGAVLGHFGELGVDCEVKEIECQWKDDTDGCLYEITWS